MPLQSRPFCPCFSQSDSPGQSADVTIRPVHVFGCPVTDRPCGKVSALGSGSGFRARGVATIATSATHGAMAWGVSVFGFGRCPPATVETTVTNPTWDATLGAIVAVVALQGCPAPGALSMRRAARSARIAQHRAPSHRFSSIFPESISEGLLPGRFQPTPPLHLPALTLWKDRIVPA